VTQYTGPFPQTRPNPDSTYTSIEVDNQTFTGAVSNAGTLSGALTGISVIDSSTITGGIIDSGIIAPTNTAVFGISIDASSEIIAKTTQTAVAIAVDGPTFTGGISNAGTLVVYDGGIQVGYLLQPVSLFSGGIDNSGNISLASYGIGIGVSSVAQFINSNVGGGITNSGTISAAIDIAVNGGETFQGGIDNTGKLVSITPDGYVIDVSGPSSFSGDITNSGEITGGGRGGIFVGYVASFSGNVVNAGPGTISDDPYGIVIFDDTQFGIAAGGGVTNSGAITGANIGIEAAYDTAFTGNIVNSRGGTINASHAGILVSSVGQFGTANPGGGIVNAGTITGGGYGILVGVSASGVSRTISAFSGGISNTGTLSVGVDGVFVGGFISEGGSLTISDFAGGIVNASNSTISVGGEGIVVGGVAAFDSTITISTFAGGISNAGTVSGGDGIVVGGFAGETSSALTIDTFTGGITNAGTLSVGYDGIIVGGTAEGPVGSTLKIVDFTGGIVNSGALTAGSNAIVVGGKAELGTNTAASKVTVTVSTFQGGITNSGTISGGTSGIKIANVSTFSGDIGNTGTIEATRNSGIYVVNVANFTDSIVNSTGGTISGGLSGIVASNVTVFGGGITNSGTIVAGTADKGISVYQVPDFQGSLVNTADASISGGSGIAVDYGSLFDGGVSNYGVITAGHNGIIAFSESTFQGNIVNDAGGTISAHSGIAVDFVALFGGDITNSGTITGGSRGINVGSNQTFQGNIVNETGGIISASFAGIDVNDDGTFGGGVTNSGAITNPHLGIDIYGDQSFAGNIVNTTKGMISATFAGILISQVGQFGNAIGGGVTNSGAITNAQFGVDLYEDQSFAGNIVNAATGTITAGTAGILLSRVGQFGTSNAIGGITNAGTIKVTGDFGEGIFVGATDYDRYSTSVSAFAGGITNLGTITTSDEEPAGIFVGGVAHSGGSVTLSTFSGGITNSGGTISAGNVYGNGIIVGGTAVTDADVTLLTFAGGVSNSGTISAGGNGIIVGGFARNFYYDYNTRSASVTVDDFSGGITNSGSVTAGGAGIIVGGTAESGAQITISTFANDIVNSGTISAGGDGIFVGGKVSYYHESYPFYTTVLISTFDGGITNSGTISAGGAAGIFVGAGPTAAFSGVAQFTGNIVNSASIGGNTPTPGGTITGGVGIELADIGTFTGNIVNGTGALITAKTGSGIQIGTAGFTAYGYSYFDEAVESFIGGITNNGTITFSEGPGAFLRAGIQIGTFDANVLMSTFSGGVTNAGTISVSATGTGLVLGVFVSGVSEFSGGITNAGTGFISAETGIALYSDATVAGGITNAGAITAARAGIVLSQVTQFGSSGAPGNISNSGTISAATGIYIAGSTIDGSIVDTGDILATAHGISIGHASEIIAPAPTAISITGETFTGGIANAGSVAGSTVGIGVEYVASFSGGISNNGEISGSEDGIEIYHVGTFSDGIVNGSEGAISSFGGVGIDVSLAAGDTFSGGITNSGTISAGGAGVIVDPTIVQSETFLGGITNNGSITANSVGIGVANIASFGGGITNTGTISGDTGIKLTGTPGTSVFDSGVIDGTGGTAVKLDPSSGTDTFTLAPGYTITGNVVGGGSDTLALGGTGAASFNLGDVGTTYTGFTTFDVTGGTWNTSGTGSDWTVEGGTLEVNGSVTDTTVDSGGTLTILPGGSADPTTVEAGGTETISAGGSDDGAQISGGTQYDYGSASNATVFSGGLQVVESGGVASDTTINGGTMDVVSGGSAGASIDFAGTGTLQIDGPNTPGILLPGTTVSGFTLGDTIDLPGIAYSTPNSAGVNGSDQLQFTEGGNTYEIQLAGNYAGQIFALAPDGNSPVAGTDITVTPCYCRGTLIRTARGQKKVENLKIGEMVKTASGAARPIKWIGRRSYGGRFVMGRKDILPVCIKAGALADNVPARDLWISPNHAMYFKDRHGEGVLIEAGDLVNGASIVQAQSVEKIEYIHIELETHDVIIAEGAPSETFIDDDDRALFHNAHEYWRLYPDEEAPPAAYCAPRLYEGYEIEAVRRRLARRAGLRPRRNAPRIGALRGYIDSVAPGRVAGWAQNIDHPEAPVCLDIYAAGKLIGQVLANRPRDDLRLAGLGSGRHGFEFTPPPGLAFAPEGVAVRRALDGAALRLTEAAQTARAKRQQDGFERSILRA
jgi:hypothetical protein